MIAPEREFLQAWQDLHYPPGPEMPEEPQPVQVAQAPIEGPGGAAFGVFPAMRSAARPGVKSEAAAMLPADVAAGAAKGTITGAFGLPGDIESLIRGVRGIFQRGGDQGKLDAFLAGMEENTILPTSEDVSKWLDANVGPVVPPGAPMAKERAGVAAAGQFAGELASSPAALVKGAAATGAAAKTLAPKAAEMTEEFLRRQGLTPGIVQPGPAVVSTRLPTAAKATEKPLEQRLVIDLEATKRDPEAFVHNVNLVRQYPNFVSRARTPDKQAEDFINEVKDNLLFLHDQVPEATRQRSKLWYDGARNITDRFSSQYQVPDQAVAGVLAVLSPQKDWFMNVSLGERVLDIMAKAKAAPWDSDMDQMAQVIWKDEKYAPMLQAIRGKTLEQITDPGLKAMWLRTYDQAKLPREHQIVSPEGDFVGIRTNDNGSPTKTAWGSLNEIGKAVVILDDPRIETISMNLGNAHKVRNFYNNIYAPTDPAGHVTIDTHAVAAGLMRPLSGNSREVLHNFGSGVLGEGGPKNSTITGVRGTYGLYAEAYRRAAQERGILPREMQSITWEAVRGLFPDTFKTSANASKIDSVWLQYRRGKLSLDEARNEVFRIAGGINAPEWERAGLRPGPAQEVQSTPNAGQLPGAGLPGGGTARPGRVQPATGNSSSVKRGRQAPAQGAE